mgnify:CR=1 FL=1
MARAVRVGFPDPAAGPGGFCLDKRKIIAAYRQGFITLEQCAQLLGLDSPNVVALLGETGRGPLLKRAVRGTK